MGLTDFLNVITGRAHREAEEGKEYLRRHLAWHADTPAKRLLCSLAPREVLASKAWQGMAQDNNLKGLESLVRESDFSPPEGSGKWAAIAPGERYADIFPKHDFWEDYQALDISEKKAFLSLRDKRGNTFWEGLNSEWIGKLVGPLSVPDQLKVLTQRNKEGKSPLFRMADEGLLYQTPPSSFKKGVLVAALLDSRDDAGNTPVYYRPALLTKTGFDKEERLALCATVNNRLDPFEEELEERSPQIFKEVFRDFTPEDFEQLNRRIKENTAHAREDRTRAEKERRGANESLMPRMKKGRGGR